MFVLDALVAFSSYCELIKCDNVSFPFLCGPISFGNAEENPEWIERLDKDDDLECVERWVLVKVDPLVPGFGVLLTPRGVVYD